MSVAMDATLYVAWFGDARLQLLWAVVFSLRLTERIIPYLGGGLGSVACHRAVNSEAMPLSDWRSSPPARLCRRDETKTGGRFIHG